MTTQTMQSHERGISKQPFPPRLVGLSREAIRRYFEMAWALEDYLFTALVDEDAFYTYGEPLRHPPMFYLLHSPVFYINKLLFAGEDVARIDPEIEEVFAEGIDPPDVQSREPLRMRPSLAAARGYREQAFRAVSAWLDTVPIPDCVSPGTPCWALMMAIEHQRIHFETSSVIFRQVPLARLHEPQGWVYAPSRKRTPANEFVPVAAGEAILGRGSDASTFGWDNEFGEKTVHVPAFTVTKNLISNGEYLEFQKASPDLPLPRFWIPSRTGMRYRAMFKETDLPLDWPVEVDYYLTEAYAKWIGAELPHEAEYARYSSRSGDESVNFMLGSPRPVDTPSRSIVNDPAGNVWQWLDEEFYPLPGFALDPFYENFSAPYFTEDHKMMLGGSWATTGGGALPSYRLWFRKHFYQHAGFRVVRRNG